MSITVIEKLVEALEEYLHEDEIATDYGNGVGGPVRVQAQSAIDAGRAEIARLKEQPQQPVHLVSPVPTSTSTTQPMPFALRVSSENPRYFKEDSGCDEVVGESRTVLGCMWEPEHAALVVHRWNTHAELLQSAKAVAYSNGFDAAYPDKLNALCAAIAKATGAQEGAQSRRSQSGDQKQDQPEFSSGAPSNSAGDEA